MVMPWRISARGAAAWIAQSPNIGALLGNQGTGARTKLLASPLATRWRSRFSTKMPWLGRPACGNNVVKVNSRIGEGRVAGLTLFGRDDLARATASSGGIKCLWKGHRAASGQAPFP